MKFLVVIIGPTAIGKTSLSIAVARHLDCEILSCDSRQFFREMNIGTAVPNADELAAAPHHFIQDRSIFQPYSVGDFEKDALSVLNRLYLENDAAVMVGGSGLYVDAVLKGFDDFPEPDPSARAMLNAAFETQGLVFLQQLLREKDPAYYNIVDTANPQRMMRALEVCLSTGQPYSTYLSKKTNTRPFTPIVIGLEAERPVLYDRINRRVDAMMESGLLDEARMLYAHRDLNALQTVGYRELFTYLDGEWTLDFAVSEIKKNTRRFAKRQLTWFKRTENATWFDYQTPLAVILAEIENQMKRHAHQP